MMKKNILVIYGTLLMSLLLAGCTSGQSPTSTIPVVPPTITLTVVPPTPAIPVEIRAVTLEPLVLKNGDSFFVRVNAHLGGHPIKVVLSQLDTTKKESLTLTADGEESYSRKFTISYGNMAANGKKTIMVTTMDNMGNSVVSVTQAELQNPAPIIEPNPPNDNFESAYLDWRRWSFDDSGGGTVKFNDGKLIISTSDQDNSGPRIYSVWKFSGDFDIQVDFQDGGNWNFPETSHTDSAVLGIEIDGDLYHLSRLIRSKDAQSKNVMLAWSSLETISKERPVPSVAGKLRLIRTGGSLIYLYDIGDGWVELGSVTLPVSPARVYMGIQSVYHSQVFSTYFDNFTINSGQTDY